MKSKIFKLQFYSLPMAIIFFSFFLRMEDAHSQQIEYIDGARFVHNQAPSWGNNVKIRLDLLKILGDDSNNSNENYLFYKPTDIVIDAKGNTYILDAGNCEIKKYNSNGEYVSSLGRRGQGPAEFLQPQTLEIDKDGNMYVSDERMDRIIVLNALGKEINRFQLNKNLSLFRLSSLDNFVVGLQVWNFGYEGFIPIIEPGQYLVPLLRFFDQNGELKREIKLKNREFRYGSEMEIIGNSFVYDVDNKDRTIVAFRYQNRIERYTADGLLDLKIDRVKDFEESSLAKKISLSPTRFAMDVNKFSIAVAIDSKYRIWVLSQKRQRTEIEIKSNDRIDNIFIFEIYNKEGILLGNVPLKQYDYNFKIRLINDRLYIIDKYGDMVIYIYEIVEI